MELHHEREEAMIYAIDEENNFYRAQVRAILFNFLLIGFCVGLKEFIKLFI